MKAAEAKEWVFNSKNSQAISVSSCKLYARFKYPSQGVDSAWKWPFKINTSLFSYVILWIWILRIWYMSELMGLSSTVLYLFLYRNFLNANIMNTVIFRRYYKLWTFHVDFQFRNIYEEARHKLINYVKSTLNNFDISFRVY